jgi:hypothetical protein
MPQPRSVTTGRWIALRRCDSQTRLLANTRLGRPSTGTFSGRLLADRIERDEANGRFCL